MTVIDFMLARGGYSDLVRLVRGESGQVRMAMEARSLKGNAK